MAFDDNSFFILIQVYRLLYLDLDSTSNSSVLGRQENGDECVVLDYKKGRNC